MANKKISELISTTDIKNEDIIPIVQNGVTKKISYENLREISISPTTPTSNESVWFKKGKNKLDKDNDIIVNGYLANNLIVINKAREIDRTICVKCEANTQYTVSRSVITSSFRVAYTDVLNTADGSYPCYGKIADDSANSIEITTGANAKYLLIHFGHTNDANLQESLNTLQVEQGPATTYEPYIEKEIYVKNDNGVFERFINVDDINNKLPIETEEVSLGNGTYYKKYGKVVSVYGQSRGGITLSNDYLELGRLPIGARPSRQILGIWSTNCRLGGTQWKVSQ